METRRKCYNVASRRRKEESWNLKCCKRIYFTILQVFPYQMGFKHIHRL